MDKRQDPMAAVKTDCMQPAIVPKCLAFPARRQKKAIEELAIKSVTNKDPCSCFVKDPVSKIKAAVR